MVFAVVFVLLFVVFVFIVRRKSVNPTQTQGERLHKGVNIRRLDHSGSAWWLDIKTGNHNKLYINNVGILIINE